MSWIRKKFGMFVVLVTAAVLTGCAGRHSVFEDRPVIEDADDRSGSPVPDEDDFDFREYAISSSVRYPLVDFLDPAAGRRSRDVNALDEVPASAWFEPRLGTKELTADEILKGPREQGPPQTPVQVLKIKESGSAPGFMIRDARGVKYLIKFDSLRELPGFETTINFVTNRLYWAFGYHVPEDYVFYFSKQDLKPGDSGADRQAVDAVLNSQETDKNRQFRVTASRFIPGKVLGHTAQRGTRQGDVHDTIPHEDRRSLRALYVLSALTGNSGMRSDNTLDVYTGEVNEGFTQHYILDFGEAFGVHGMNYTRKWEGSDHFFSWESLWRNILTLGLTRKPWERIETPVTDIRTYYESDAFDPAKWKETWQFVPIRRAQADDHYWAVKIMAGFKREHLTRLFSEAGGISPDDQDYLIETFFKRRDKLLRYHLKQVTPLESSGIQNGRLSLKDLHQEFLNQSFADSYRVDFYGPDDRKPVSVLDLRAQDGRLEIPLPERILSEAGDYLRIEVRSLDPIGGSGRPAEFHVRKSKGHLKLVGIMH